MDMAGGRVCGGSNISLLPQSQMVLRAAEPFDSFFLSGTSASFLGPRSIVSFDDGGRGNKSNKSSFFQSFDHEEYCDEEMDEYFHQPDKKRRLTSEQVQFLEKNFELENKLEPERKIQLAKDLGLQPRQVAIWFQNRRARWKTKQLEKDYEALQESYDSLKTECDSLIKETDKLKSEVSCLTEKLQLREREKENSEFSDRNKLCQEPPQKQILDPVPKGEMPKFSAAVCKREKISPSKSDIFDSERPHYNDGVHSSLLDPSDSSYIVEPDQSDLSQDEDDNLSKSLMPTYIFPKIDADYSDPPANSSNFGFPVEDQAFWSWSY